MDTKVSPPATMSRLEKRSFRRLVGKLVEVGIDPAARVELIADFVRAEERIEELRLEQAAARGKARLQLIRATNVAAAERRRLHDALFKGARRPPRPSRADHAINSDRFAVLDPTDADRGWWGGLAVGVPRDKLERQYGPPSWLVLLEDNEAAAVESARAIRQSHRRGPLAGDGDEQR